jgi:nucleotide-binding universal stress UspA family protein
LPYKSILVQVDHTKANPGRVDAAIAMALRHEAHLIGLYLTVEPSGASFARGYLPEEILAHAAAEALALANDRLARFSAAAKRNLVPFETRIGRGFEVELCDLVSMHALYADLVVDGQDDPDDPPLGRQLPEHLVLATGRPILLIPYIGAGATMGDRVVIAWDASREAARAVIDAMPILVRASAVMVVTVNPRQKDFGHGEMPGADIALHLARHGVEAEVQRVENRDMDVGNALLSHLADVGADLLVMGAYGHSRLREIVLGGATRTVLGDMTVPVLMSH